MHSFGTCLCFVVAGMMAGAYVWGSAADSLGRKRVLIAISVMNALCIVASSFSQNYELFMLFRFLNGAAWVSLPLYATICNWDVSYSTYSQITVVICCLLNIKDDVFSSYIQTKKSRGLLYLVQFHALYNTKYFHVFSIRMQISETLIWAVSCQLMLQMCTNWKWFHMFSPAKFTSNPRTCKMTDIYEY